MAHSKPETGRAQSVPAGRWRTALLLVLAVTLAGCTKGMGDLTQYVAQVKARKPGPIEPLPQIKPYETFTYSDSNMRSPFSPDTQAQPEKLSAAGSGIHPDFNRNKEYLEQYPLDALTMVGTIEMGGRTYALIKDGDGVVHRVTIGNHLGQNYGKITKITETGIKLTEIVPNGLGGWMERSASLSLSQ